MEPLIIWPDMTSTSPPHKVSIPFEKTISKVLIISYSFSGQTSNLLRSFQKGMESKGCTVTREKLYPLKKLKFPTSGFLMCLKMMIITCLRWRVPVKNLSESCQKEYDLVIIAGPTWSYNPSGPILSLIDRDGEKIFNNKIVIPFISCRGYWRVHWYGLRCLLHKCGAAIPNLIVFSHPNKEPWRTIGVFCKIAGKNPERSDFLGKFYNRFGHSRLQQEEAEHFGHLIGDALQNDIPLSDLDFHTPIALP